MKNLFILLIIGLLLSSCGRYSEKELQNFDNQITQYIKKNQLDMIKSESGLYYKIHQQGEGKEIKNNAFISTQYKGKLLNGDVFDEQKEPVELQVNQLVHGWREVVYYLKQNGKATIIIPPNLGYGKQKKEKIPENSILIFDLEIVDVY